MNKFNNFFFFKKKRICVNNSANPIRRPDGTFEQIDNKPDCALLELADKMGFKFENYRNSEKVNKIERNLTLNKKRSLLIVFIQYFFPTR